MVKFFKNRKLHIVSFYKFPLLDNQNMMLKIVLIFTVLFFSENAFADDESDIKDTIKEMLVLMNEGKYVELTKNYTNAKGNIELQSSISDPNPSQATILIREQAKNAFKNALTKKIEVIEGRAEIKIDKGIHKYLDSIIFEKIDNRWILP